MTIEETKMINTPIGKLISHGSYPVHISGTNREFLRVIYEDERGLRFAKLFNEWFEVKQLSMRYETVEEIF